MNRFTAPSVLIVATLLWGYAGRAADSVGFEPYEAIIKRSPFGSLTPASGAPAAQPGFAEQYSFVGLIRDGDRVMAMIFDKTGNKVEFKAQGESIGDIKVNRIEPSGDASKIELQRGTEKAALTYTPRSSAPAVAAPPAPLPPGAIAATPAAPPPTAPGAPPVRPPRPRIPFRRGE